MCKRKVQIIGVKIKLSNRFLILFTGQFSEIRNVQSLNNFKKIKTSKNTIGSITLLAGHGMVQTCSCGGLVHVARGEHVSVHVQVTGPRKYTDHKGPCVLLVPM